MTKIVIVEDHPILRNIYKKKFTSEGYVVETARNGLEGLELIKLTRPDLVLLDLELPDINGVEVVKELRANPTFKILPIFIFSNSDWAAAAVAAGATMVVSKTTHSPGDLLSLVERILPSAARPEEPEDLEKPLLLRSPPEAELQLTGSTAKPVKNKVVIVDDNPVLRELYQAKFTRAGYDVHVAADGQEGLDTIRNLRPDLVLLDLVLPKLSGAHVLEQLRADPLFEKLPVFIFSNSSWMTIDSDTGPTKVLSKPAHCPTEILEIVQQLLPVSTGSSAFHASGYKASENNILEI